MWRHLSDFDKEKTEEEGLDFPPSHRKCALNRRFRIYRSGWRLKARPAKFVQVIWRRALLEQPISSLHFIFFFLKKKARSTSKVRDFDEDTSSFNRNCTQRCEICVYQRFLHAIRKNHDVKDTWKNAFYNRCLVRRPRNTKYVDIRPYYKSPKETLLSSWLMLLYSSQGRWFERRI